MSTYPCAARIHSDGIGCARWSATSFARRACSSAEIVAGSSRNSGPSAIAFLTAGRSPISSNQRFTFGNSSILMFLVAQLEAKAKLDRPILLHAILETARGVANVEEICGASPRMQGL